MKFDKIIKLFKEYDIYPFQGRYSNINGNYMADKVMVPKYSEGMINYTTNEDKGYGTYESEEYSMAVYHDWCAFNFVVFLNILNASLIKEPNKIPLIKVLRQIVQPFNFGLKEAKEFVEKLEDLKVIYDANKDSEKYSYRRYELTARGDQVLAKINTQLPTGFDDTITRIFAKVLLLDEKLLVNRATVVDNMIKEHFSFHDMYNERKEELELGV